MRRRLWLILVTIGLVAACGSSATPTPPPSGTPGPAPTDVFVGTPEPTSTASTPVETAAPTASPVSGKTYKVKSGDTLWGIAQKYGITVEALKAANPKVDPKAMRVGTILVIPAK